MNLIYDKGPFGDSTTSYNVETEAKYVAQFIEEVLKERSNEWGQFCIFSNDRKEDACVCSYDRGRIIRRAKDYDAFGAAKITSIYANGGWGSMGYDIKVENFDALPKQDKEDFQMVYWGRIICK